MHKSLVSVVIPYFDKPSTINRSIISVVSQTYSYWELIIIDDGSFVPLVMTEDWKVLPIRILRNEVNIGPGPSRQKGMELASGEFIAFLDSDDWWDSNFLEAAVNVHFENKDIAASWCKSITKTRLGNLERRYNSLEFTQIVETIIEYARPWSTSSLLWKKKYCGEWGNLSTNQDLWFEISSSFKSNSVKKIDEYYCFVDQTAENRREDLVLIGEIYSNNFCAYEYLEFRYKNVEKRNFKLKVIIFHRLLRTLSRIKRNGSFEDYIIYSKRFKSLYPRLTWLIDIPHMSNLLEKFLKNTFFKVNY